MDENTLEIGLLLKTIAEPTRFKIVQLLQEHHHCSRSLALSLGISESAVSQHMSMLKQQRVVMYFRHGYHVHYVLNPDALERIRAAMAVWISRTQNIEDCHAVNPCQYVLDNGSNGCLYRSGSSSKRERNATS